MKKMFFLTGLPRSGNTLLSSLMNQNPDISCTGFSMLSEIFSFVDFAKTHQRYQNYNEPNLIDCILKNLITNPYGDNDKDIIINRGDWINPYTFRTLLNVHRDLNREVKIIVCVRDILEIIRSFINLCNQNPNFEINQQYRTFDKKRLYTSEFETKCDLIMQKDHYVDKMICRIKWIVDNKFTEYCHFVEYNDLVNNTEETIKKIYDFLNLDYFQHHFKNLSQINVNGNVYDDNVYNAPLHKLRTNNIEKQKHDIILPEKVIQKYSNLEFWREKTE